MNKPIGKSVPGFTLMELLVSMILFITVTSMGYLLLLNVQRGIHKVQDDDAYFMHFVEFATLFEKDVQQALHISEGAKEIVCTMSWGDIRYEFKEEEVIRMERDWQATFPIKLQQYEGHYASDTDVLIALDLKFDFHGNVLPMYVYKPHAGRIKIQKALSNAH